MFYILRETLNNTPTGVWGGSPEVGVGAYLLANSAVGGDCPRHKKSLFRLSLEEMQEAILQVDHRVPYEIGGEHEEKDMDYFMLLSPSANRAKSWTCEHCTNWVKRDKDFCMRCFWAHPEDYDHVAGRFEKVISIIFTGDEIEDYNKLVSLAGEKTAQETIKELLHEHLRNL